MCYNNINYIGFSLPTQLIFIERRKNTTFHVKWCAPKPPHAEKGAQE